MRLTVRMLHLVRHGAFDPVDDDSDPGLNDKGRAQADLVAARLLAAKHPSPVVRLVSSTMRRAKETADVIARAFPDLPRAEDESLREGFPTRAGLPPGVEEPPEDFWRDEAARMERCWETFFRPADTPTVEILVSHGNWIRGLTVRALGVDRDAWTRLGLNHCALTTLLVTPDGPMVVRANDVGHLPPELVSVR